MFTNHKTQGDQFNRLRALLEFGIGNGDTLPTITVDAHTAGSLFYKTIADEGLYTSNGSVWTRVGTSIGTTDNSSRIVSGFSTWSGTGYVFDVTATDYFINGTQHATTATQITHAAADATLNRIDVQYLDDTNNVGIITGTPAASPLKPQVDPTSQIELSFVFVAAASVTPTLISNTIFYDENTESTAASDVATANFANATAPFNGSLSTFIGAFTNGQFLSYRRASLTNASDFNFVKFYIKLNATFASGTYLTLYFYNNLTQTSQPLNIVSGQFGFSRTVVGTWQLITIPMSSIVVNTNAFDKIYFRLNSTNASGFYLDYLFLQTGNTGGASSTGVNSFNLRTGNVMPLATDYPPAFIGAESLSNKGIANGYASLDAGGKVPSGQLPAYVDDVLEFADLASFPVTGTASIIYVALDTNNTYRWTGATYIQIGGTSVAAASETVAGILEIATQVETDAGTDDTRAITALKLETRLTAFDDIIAFANLAAFPVTGTVAKLYRANDTDIYYKWNGASYAVFGSGGSGTVATAAELNTGTDNAKFASALALEDSKYLNRDGTKIHATATGTDTYSATLVPALTAYVAGQQFNIKFTNANTGASTLNINTLGAIAILKDASTALAAGNISANRIVTLVYDGTNFQTIGAAAAAGGGAEFGAITGDPVDQTNLQDATLQTSYTPTSGTVVVGDTLKEAIQKLDAKNASQDVILGSSQAGNNLFNYYNFR